MALITGIIEGEESDLLIQRTDLMAKQTTCAVLHACGTYTVTVTACEEEDDAKHGCLLKTET